MHVISGKAKGRKLKAPKDIRPLTGRVKEALFNILRNKIVDSYFLDLFAGSGAVGIEALSRGAKLAIFVEHNRKTVEFIRENLRTVSFSDRTEVYALNVTQALKILSQKGAKFDIIFLGAPYGSPKLSEALEALGILNLLNKDGVVIAEHRFKQLVDPNYGSLTLVREEKYGDTVLKFYENSNLSG